MKLVDLNVLLYAVNKDDPHHLAAKRRWEVLLNANEPVGLAWITLIGFVRLTTHRAVFPCPQSLDQAIRRVTTWLDHPNTRLIVESENHWQILQELLLETNVGGAIVTDMHLAAIAISRGAALVSFDADFSRFPRLRWENPRN